MEEEEERPSSIKKDSQTSESLDFIPDPNFLEEMNKRMADNDRYVLKTEEVEEMEESKPTKWKMA